MTAGNQAIKKSGQNLTAFRKKAFVFIFQFQVRLPLQGLRQPGYGHNIRTQ